MNLNRLLGSATIALGLAVGSSASAATLTFFGEDLSSSALVPLGATPNADSARADFLANLTGVGTEDFEGQSGSAPLGLTFPGSSGSITATLGGGSGSVQSVTPGTTNGAGRYATSGSNYWEVTAGGSGNFQITFSSAVAAFGFYGLCGELALAVSDRPGSFFVAFLDSLYSAGSDEIHKHLMVG